MATNDVKEAGKLNSLEGECIGKGDFPGALEHLSKALDVLPDDAKKAKARIFTNMGHVNVQFKKV